MLTIAFILTLAGPEDDAAAAALDGFKTSYKTKDVAARTAAVQELSKTPHLKVAQKLSQLLLVDEPDVRVAAAGGLALQREQKKVALTALVGAIKPNATQPPVLVAIFGALAKFQDEASLPEMHKYFPYLQIEVPKALIEAVALIRSSQSIDPLIAELKEADELLRPRTTDAAGGGRGFGAGFGRGGMENAREKRDRARELQPMLKKALTDITGIHCEDGKDWESWWKENRNTFKGKK